MLRYQDYILNSNGQPVSGASVLVRPVGSTNTSVIYGTNTGTATKTNPLTSDDSGHFWFYGTNGRYDLVVSGSYISTTTACDIHLDDVPLTNLAELSTASSARDNIGLGSMATQGTASWFRVSNNLSEVTTAAAARANLGLAIGTNVPAYNAAAAFTTGSQTFTGGQRGAAVALASTGAISPDFAAANNFTLGLTVANTLGTPTNVAVGQGGCVVITQAATAVTLAMGSFWKWAGTSTGTVSTATGTVDVLAYQVITSTSALAYLHNGVA